MIKDKIIVIDLDSTIINTARMVINLHNKLNLNKQIEYIEDCSWKFKPMIKTDEELSELFNVFDHKDFYNNTIYTKNAKEIVNKLSQEYEVIICSKHNNTRKPITRAFIKKEFPNCKLKFVDNFKDKSKIDCDFVIDDKIETLEGFVNKNTVRICFGNYQWNKEYIGIREVNWNNIYEYIHKMVEIKKEFKLVGEICRNKGIF